MRIKLENILKKAKEGRVQEEIVELKCSKYKTIWTKGEIIYED